MEKKVKIECVKDEDFYLNYQDISVTDLQSAFEECLKQLDQNIDYLQGKFPGPATKQLMYPRIENIEWTNGFWSGMLWLAYEYTHNEKYRLLAEEHVESFLYRVKNDIELNHHDLGFLYTLSCISAYKLTGNKKAREAALLAAEKLTKRWQEKGQFLQAWGPLGSPEHYRFIIDCMLNIPLLYWASEETNDKKYKQMAQSHFETSCKYVIRDDASAYHTFYMNPETGEPDHGATRQGYSDDSSWARGQAWGIYGIPLNTRYTGSMEYENLYRGITNYFLNRLPKDHVCFWDLIFTDGDDQSRDSSAAAIAVCGMLEMNRYLEDDHDKRIYRGACNCILKSLIDNYTDKKHKPGNPILYHGVYSWHSNKGVDEGNIWGDYFYMEALLRMLKEWNPYW